MKHHVIRAMASLATAAGLSTALCMSVSAATTLTAGGSGANVAAGTSGSTFVKVFSNGPAPNGALTTEDLQPTSDGGHIVLALARSASSDLVSWLLKLDSTGTPQWQEELGCFNAPGGNNSDGVSVQQSSDGGYIVGGGTIGCGGSGSTGCAELSGASCAYVVKLNSAGKVGWAKVYNDSGFSASSINRIKQTSDGGYIAAGTAADNSNGNTAGLVLKLDSSGNVQWQRELSPSGSTTNTLLNAVRQTSDGGYITVGQFTTSSSRPVGNILVVKLDSGGNLQWQNGYANLNSSGVPVDGETVNDVIQTSDGGYLVGGDWSDGQPGLASSCCHGGLLLKLTSSGGVQWQHAYTRVLPNGNVIGSEINSLSSLPGGGYLLAGASDLLDSTGRVILGLVPYLAQTDSGGTLTRQNLYTERNPSTGRPISQTFAGASLLANGGVQAAGFTEDPASGIGDLYLVQTDSAGQVGTTCSNVNAGPPLNDVNPGLAPVTAGVSITTAVNAPASSPTKVVTGTPTFTKSC
jgi:hypothetical protein